MIIKDLNTKTKGLYSAILKNKLISICVFFTFFTMIDSISILIGWWPPKTGFGPYHHLLMRFALFSILILGLYLFNILKQIIKSKLLVYFITFFITWFIILVYIWLNDHFIELHPDAYKDISISYIFVYSILGIIILISHFKNSAFYKIK